MYFDVSKLVKLFPQITTITREKITENETSDIFEQEIIILLSDKKEYSIKLIFSHKFYRAELNNVIYLNDYSIACVTTTNFNDAIRDLISERYNNQYPSVDSN